MKNNKEVDPNSQEWSHIDYQLQLITGKSSLKIISIYSYTDPNPSDLDLKTDMIIHATDFNKEYIDRVVGKTIPLQDIIIYCGHVNIHPIVQPNKVFTFLLGKVQLGKMGTLKDDVTLLDSMLIQSEAQKDAFQYNFFVRNHAQYSIKYEINFTIGDQKEFNIQDYPCTMCQNKSAVIYCRTEQYYFCQECSRDHHKTRLMQNHQLQKIDRINTLPLCKTHNQRFSQFCHRCQKYLCVVCLQKGNSHGNNEHPVTSIAQMYEEKRQNNEVLPLKQRDKLQGLLRSLHIKRQQIQQNYTTTKKYIQEQFQKALTNLNQLLLQKVLTINSDELQLRMIIQKLEWSKAFIKFQQKNLKPIFYFQSQQKFEQEMTKMKINQYQSVFNIKADLTAEGEIVVGRRDVLNRSRRKAGPNTSRSQLLKTQLKASNPSLGNSKQKSIYDYNPQGEQLHLGDLTDLLSTSNLNFFFST